MKKPVQDFDRRPHAILRSGERVLVEDLRSRDDYTFAFVYKGESFMGEDLPPSLMTSVWFRSICGYCMKPVEDSGGVTRIIPPSWGGARGPWNLAFTCDECIRWKGTKTGWITYDGREGVYWNGDAWNGEKFPRPKFARDAPESHCVYLGRHDVEAILPHRLRGIGNRHG